MKRTPIQRKTQMNRGKRLNPMSMKRRNEKATRDAVRVVTLARANNQCEAIDIVPHIQCGGPLDVDERVGRGVHPDAHLDVTITQVLCRRHHDWKHTNPIEAHDVGLTYWSWEYSEAKR